LYFLPNIIGVIKKDSEIGRGCGTSGRMRELFIAFLWRNLKE
jgi:hypothetical protein